MKKLLSMIFVGVLLFAPLAVAGDFDDFFDEDVRANVYGFQVDAPQLIKVSEDVSIGAEWTKDIRQETWEGHTFLVKVTTLFNWKDLTAAE